MVPSNGGSAGDRSAPWRRRMLFGFTAMAALLIGYDLGVMAGAILFIGQDLKLDAATVGLVVSAVSIGSLPTSVFAGPLQDRFGRKRPLLVAMGVLIIASLGMAGSTSSSMLVWFRILIGVGTCLATVTVPTYLAELAPTTRRGGLTSLYQLMWATGALLAFVVDYLLAGSGAWRAMVGVGAGLAVVIAIGLSFQPESPRWLMRQGREAEARAALAISTPGEQETVLTELRASLDVRVRSKLIDLIRSRPLRRVLVLACTMAALQQLIGINTIVFYAPTILKAAGFGSATAILNSVGLGVLSVLATLLEIRLIDRVGRRTLLLTGASLMGASMLTLAILFGLSGQDTVLGKVTALIAIAVFKAAFSLSWGPVLWVTLPELFPLKHRGTGVGTAVLCLTLAQFVVTLTFPSLLAFGPAAIFSIFAGFCLVALLFAARLLRELTGQSLEQIAATTLAAEEPDIPVAPSKEPA